MVCCMSDLFFVSHTLTELSSCPFPFNDGQLAKFYDVCGWINY